MDGNLVFPSLAWTTSAACSWPLQTIHPHNLANSVICIEGLAAPYQVFPRTALMSLINAPSFLVQKTWQVAFERVPIILAWNFDLSSRTVLAEPLQSLLYSMCLLSTKAWFFSFSPLLLDSINYILYPYSLSLPDTASSFLYSHFQ